MIGIDEVGRGALAGPVVLAALAMKGRVSFVHPKLGPIRDSKKLTSARRLIWFEYLTTQANFSWRVSRVSPAVIDRINIARAADLAAFRLCRRFAVHHNKSHVAFVWLDGGLRLPEDIPHEAVIRGDESIPLIAGASIIAKVIRDRYMARILARRFPAYGFEIHKGYGTRAHYASLRRVGPSVVHRRSFLA